MNEEEYKKAIIKQIKERLDMDIENCFEYLNAIKKESEKENICLGYTGEKITKLKSRINSIHDLMIRLDGN